MNYKVLNKDFDKLTSEEFLSAILQQRGEIGRASCRERV